ncbi:MAG: hypothetical protein K2P84_00110 [Undibacterium sp.]|nr:hypothetical protein [Undibacterium sp.]
MTAATADRNTVRREGQVLEVPMKAAAKIYAGTMVVVDAATNLAIPAKTGLGLKSVGVSQCQCDNSTGLDGEARVRVFRGPEVLYRMSNSAAGDLIVLGDIGADCYLVDDQTVAKTNGSNARSVAGKVRDVDSVGVWVEF